jgi:predicted phosphodiesterase
MSSPTPGELWCRKQGNGQAAMRIAVFTDVHANLPALRAALKAIRAQGCDALFSTGDAIAIGPYPAECLDLLLSTPGLACVRGNHETWLVDGLPQPRPEWMSEGEVEHQHWTYGRIDAPARTAVARWPYLIRREVEGIRVAFMHYGLDSSGRDFVPIARHPRADELDRVFADSQADLIFYGHDHWLSDKQGRARYVNPGSLGCHTAATARYCVVEFGQQGFTVERCQALYDDRDLARAFEGRAVPEREFIYKAFFGGRFGTENT